MSFYDLIQILRSMVTSNVVYCGGIDEIKKASINQELITKEIRTIDLNTTLMYAAALKKERQEQKYDMEDAQNNEYSNHWLTQSTRLSRSAATRTVRDACRKHISSIF